MKEKQLGTNTNLLTTLKSTFLAGLSIHIMTCCWFAVSCQNQVTFSGSNSLTNTLCQQESWAQSSERDNCVFSLKTALSYIVQQERQLFSLIRIAKQFGF